MSIVEKKKLLICIPDLPFPVRRNGISIRYFPIIKHASKNFDIHLIVIADNEIDTKDISEARQYCSKISILIRKREYVTLGRRLLTRIKSLLPVGIPYDQIRYDEKEIEKFIELETRDVTYDVSLCVLTSYLHLIKKNVQASKYVLDIVDSPYAICLRNRGLSLLKTYDAYCVKVWERRAIKSVDITIYISPLDMEIGVGEVETLGKVIVLPNGLYLNDYLDAKIDYGCRTIGYLGHMGYPPNIQAALKLYREFKIIQPQIPDVKLIIIGRFPDAKILNLAKDPAVVVTGTVPSIWPYINGIDVFVFPMKTGSGQQNKLLEAMGVGRAVISSSLGNSGVGARHGRDIVIADDELALRTSIVELISSPERQRDLGDSAKEFIRKKYSWNAVLQKFDDSVLS